MNSSATADCVGTCPSNDELKRYLSGWLNDARCIEVETHSANCSLCQKALEQLEHQPDTLMQSLQSTVGHPAIVEPIASDAAVESGSLPAPVVDAALVKVSRLFDVPPDADTDRDRVWQPLRRELGMYELIKPLGRGGMGAVYLAVHKQLKKQVAIKLLPILSSEDSDVRARFDREIRVVGKLNHPSIVTATDAGEIDGTQFLVMEYVPGLDLSRLARLMGRLPVTDACELIRQSALGLSCAHAEGVVHRDVKPSNLMLDESGQIRILDFGLAQLSVWDEASVDLTTVGQLMGTLDYMAPEQAEVSSGVDYRADLYALGATLFRLLCGRAPLAAAPNQSPFEKLRLLANHQPPKLSTLCPEAPEELVKLVASLLSRNPSDRPASAAHVAEQLAPFAEGSNLVELLQQAKEKAATSPELLKKSAFPDQPPFLSPALASLAPLPASSASGRSKVLRRLVLAASLPVLIIAGILIKLETSKGQLVIESDVDNVTVRLLKDGKPVDGIQVSHGTTSTRLNADNYEITIDGPSDGLVIDNDKFTLKNGETVVARITRTLKEYSEIDPPPISALVYDGKTLSTWIELLQREQSAETVTTCLKAIATLATEEDVERLRPVLIQLIRESRNDGIAVSICRAFSEVLPKDKFHEWWCNEYSSGTHRWRDRLSLALQHIWAYADRDTIAGVAPFVSWYELRVCSSIEEPDTLALAPGERERLADHILTLGNLGNDAATNERLLELLLRQGATLDQWWLSLDGKVQALNESWQRAILNCLADRAGRIIECAESEPTSIVEAALVLSWLARRYEGRGDEGTEMVSLLEAAIPRDAIDQRLLKLAEFPEKLSEMLSVDDRLKWNCGPTASRFASTGFARWKTEVDKREAKANEVISLLDLSPGSPLFPREVSFEKDAIPPGLLAIWKIAQSVEADVADEFAVKGGLGTSDYSIVMRWPSLQPVSLKKFTEPIFREPSTFWKDHSPTPQRWFLALLHDHQVILAVDRAMKAGQVSETLTDQTRPRLVEGSSVAKTLAQTAVPLYEGKPLEHWLDMLSREKSAAGLKVAFDACSALGSPDNAQQITVTLQKALPGLDGTMSLASGNMWSQTVDFFAMQLLRKLNKGKSYFELWVREFDAADRDWQKRLWMYVNQYGPLGSSEDVEPLVVWAENRLALPASEDREANERAAEIANFLRNLTALNRQDVDAKLIERVTALLKSSTHLGETWWLSEPLVYRYGSKVTQHWTPQIKAEITRVAVEAVCKNDTDPSLVAQACMILSNGAELTNEQKAAVLSSIQRRLEEANQSPEVFTLMVTIPESFDSLVIPLVTGMSELSFGRIQISFTWRKEANVGTSKCSTVMQLLNVAYALDKDKSCQSQIQKVFDTARDVFDIVHAQRIKYLDSRTEQRGGVARNSSEPTRVPIVLELPSLTSSIDADSPIQPGTRDGLNVLLFRMLWGDHNPAKEDWLKYLILLHPVMQETVTAAIEKAAQTPPAPEATDETTPGDSKAVESPSPDGSQTPK